MVELLSELTPSFSALYQGVISSLPAWAQNFINLFLWSLLMVIYAIFVWKFYRWIAKKNLFELNLSKFNRSEHAVLAKLFGAVIYFVEYLIILPFMVFIWFGAFTIFLMLLTKDLELNIILFVAVAIVAAIRMTSYYKEELARDLAKTIPFTILAVAATQGLFFDSGQLLSNFVRIPEFLSDIWIYLIFIVAVEFILRVLDILFLAFDLHSEEEVRTGD
ncbi:MAG: hypothetical protein NUV46_03775 [Nanoarchaeota archaeon]|nr:hypothetical protein [Nanoarchaeota archaeon]